MRTRSALGAGRAKIPVKIRCLFTPNSVAEFGEFLRRRHAAIMEARPEKSPGTFKNLRNRAGMTSFVAPELVNGTLERGFEFLRALEHP